MEDKEEKVHLGMRVPQSYMDRLNALAEQFDLDRSEIARRALRNGIDDLETAAKVGSNPVIGKVVQALLVLETDQEERQEITRTLRAIREHKATKTKSRAGQAKLA